MTSSVTRKNVSNEFLDPKEIKLDNRSTSTLLNYLAELSKQFWYYTEDDKRDGDWSDFFQSDLTCVLAMVAEYNTEQDYQKVLDYVHGVANTDETDDKEVFLLGLFETAFEPVFKLNKWYLTMMRLHIHHPFYQYLKQIIWQKYSFVLRDLYGYYYHAIHAELITDRERINNLFRSFEELDAIWNYNPFPNITKEKSFSYTVSDDHKDFLAGIKQSVRQLYTLNQSVAHKAKAYFEEVLKKGDTEPHIALMISFLKLFKYYQSSLNGLVQKHMDFYYQQVLDFSPNEATTDEAYLLLKLKKGSKPYLVPASTAFAAGVDASGQAILFENTSDFLLTSAVVKDYCAFNILQGKLASNPYQAYQIKGFDKPVIKPDTGHYQSFPAFGGTSLTQVSTVTTSIGFAIASPELVLDSGKREVTIIFDLKADYKHSNTELVLKILKELSSEIIDDLLPQILSKVKQMTETVLEKILTSLLTRMADKAIEKIPNKKISSVVEKFVNGLIKSKISKMVENIFDKISGDHLLKNLEKLLPKIIDKILAIVVNETVADAVASYILKEILVVKITTKKGWMPVQLSTLSLGNDQLKSCFTIKSAQEATANYVKKTHGGSYDTEWPLLIFTLDPSSHFSAVAYEFLKGYSVSSFAISTSVCGSTSVTINTSKGKVSANAPFAPFGTNPVVGSEMIIGNYEAFIKKTKQLTLKVGWVNLPDFEDYYAPYLTYVDNHSLTTPQFTRDDYTCKLSWLDFSKGSWSTASASDTLFPKAKTTSNGTSGSPETTNTSSAKTSVIAPQSYVYDVSEITPDYNLSEKLIYSDKSKSGFISLELMGTDLAFGNSIYPQVVAQVALENTTMAAGKAKLWVAIADFIKSLIPKKKKKSKALTVAKGDSDSGDFQPMPNKPFIPKMKDVSISYNAECSTTPGASEYHELYSIHPFGLQKVTDQTIDLLPFFENDRYAFLSFDQLDENASLSILFSVQDSVDAVISEEFVPLQFEVLSKDSWEEVNLEKDGTYGLNKSGIVKLEIGDEISNQNPIMPLGKYWIRYSVPGKDSTQYNLKMLAANAVAVERVINSSNSAEDIINLKAKTISSPKSAMPEIASVSQPFGSFGGGNPEDKNTFYERVSQRLAHKNRLVSMDDTGKYILNEFKNVYKVKFKVANNSDSPTLSIGVVPQLEANQQINPYRPVASAALCGSILTKIVPLLSHQLEVNVEPVHFDTVKFDVIVTFNSSENVTLLKEKLNGQLSDFLSPWIEGNELAYGSEGLYVDDVIAFILSRKYIDSFQKLSIKINGKPVVENADNKKIKLLPSNPLNVLVPATQHSIHSVNSQPKKQAMKRRKGVPA